MNELEQKGLEVKMSIVELFSMILFDDTSPLTNAVML
jgi:hypothetical protein